MSTFEDTKNIARGSPAAMAPKATAKRRSAVKRGMTENDLIVSASTSTPTLSRRQKQHKMAAEIAKRVAKGSLENNIFCRLCFVTLDRAEWAKYDDKKQPAGHACKTHWQIYIAGYQVQFEFLHFA